MAVTTRDMGLGILGNPLLVYKRKFRWTLLLSFCPSDPDERPSSDQKTVPEQFVKMGARPQLDIEETEINYLHGKFWLPGKATWQSMTVTYYDVAGTVASALSPFSGDGSGAFPAGGTGELTSIFEWIASVYDITNPTTLQMGGALQDYEGYGILRLYDGCGQTIERWNIEGMWPQSVNFGELDMNSSDDVNIELTLRYRAVTYVPLCPSGSISRCPCTPCA